MALHKGHETLALDLVAVRDVTLERGNVIDGSVTAGGRVTLERGASVLGTVEAGASVAPLSFPRPEFEAGGADVSVADRKSLALEPGSYGRVRVGRGAVLRLRSGTYSLAELALERDAALECDVSAATVAVEVTGALALDERVELRTSAGDEGSALVALASLQTAPLEIGRGARVLGTLVAPDAEVRLGPRARFRGAIHARAITLEKGAAFEPHPSAGR